MDAGRTPEKGLLISSPYEPNCSGELIKMQSVIVDAFVTATVLEH